MPLNIRTNMATISLKMRYQISFHIGVLATYAGQKKNWIWRQNNYRAF